MRYLRSRPKRYTCYRYCAHDHLATGPETTVSYPQASASEVSALLRRPAGAKTTNDSSSLHNPEVKAVDGHTSRPAAP